jgi:hypothetical protein
VYAEFYAAVRDVNAKLPASRRLRVIAGDPPIDWSRVHERRDIVFFMERRGFPVSLNRVAVDKGAKALVIYGSAHLWRPRFPAWAAADELAESSFLAQGAPLTYKALRVLDSTRILTIVPLAGVDPIERTLKSMERPILVSLLGTRAAGVYENADSTLGERFDACIYFGKSAEATAFIDGKPIINLDASYIAELASRKAIFGAGR